MEQKKRIIDVGIIICVFLFLVAFPINIFTNSQQIITIIQCVLVFLAGVFALIYSIKSKNIMLTKEGINLRNLLILTPTLIVCFCTLPYLIKFNCFNQNIVFDRPLILNFVYHFLVVITEEIIFRKIIFDNIEIQNPTKKLFVCSAIFGIAHITTFLSTFNPVDLIQIIYTFGLGLVLGIIYTYGKSLGFAGFFHFLYNVFNKIIFVELTSNQVTFDNVFFYVSCVIVAVIAIAYISLIYFFILNKNQNN